MFISDKPFWQSLSYVYLIQWQIGFALRGEISISLIQVFTENDFRADQRSQKWRAWRQSVWLACVDKTDTLAVSLRLPPSWNSQASSSQSDPSWHSTLCGSRTDTQQSDLNWISDGQTGCKNSGVVYYRGYTQTLLDGSLLRSESKACCYVSLCILSGYTEIWDRFWGVCISACHVDYTTA